MTWTHASGPDRTPPPAEPPVTRRTWTDRPDLRAECLQGALPAAVMAIYDLSAIPCAEQLRWRAQRCPRGPYQGACEKGRPQPAPNPPFLPPISLLRQPLPKACRPGQRPTAL